MFRALLVHNQAVYRCIKHPVFHTSVQCTNSNQQAAPITVHKSTYHKSHVNKFMTVLLHTVKCKGKGHPCTGTEVLYRPYGP